MSTLLELFVFKKIYYLEDHNFNTTGRSRVYSDVVAWILISLDNNSRIENDFTKYLKESYCLCSDQYFSIKYFLNEAFA